MLGLSCWCSRNLGLWRCDGGEHAVLLVGGWCRDVHFEARVCSGLARRACHSPMQMADVRDERKPKARPTVRVAGAGAFGVKGGAEDKREIHIDGSAAGSVDGDTKPADPANVS